MEYRIATYEEVSKQFDWLIETHENKEDWTAWKNEYLSNIKHGIMIPYYGFIGEDCICEAYANISKYMDYIVIKRDRPYLSAFRTRKEYRGLGYFSKLFDFMIKDLKEKGYKRVSVAVESTETYNIEMYKHFGFNTFLYKDRETYGDGTIHEIEYYEKQL